MPADLAERVLELMKQLDELEGRVTAAERGTGDLAAQLKVLRHNYTSIRTGAMLLLDELEQRVPVGPPNGNGKKGRP